MTKRDNLPVYETSKMVKTSRFVLGTIEQNPLQSEVEEESRYKSLLAIPVLLGHGTEDPFVDVSLGRLARQIPADIGMRTEWKEHVEVDNEGCSIKEPEGLDEMVQFLRIAARQ